MSHTQTDTAQDVATINVTKPKTSRSKKVKVETEVVNEAPSLLDEFVFMDKAKKVLEVGLKTEKNIVLWGPGGHGKSELAAEFFYSYGIQPYTITMGSGMTTDRLFGGINLLKLESEGKIEYLIENSFMNHEFVIFEEMMDAPDFILESLKDILSSGYFRNGSQYEKIKTRFIVANTNRTRDEFSKNASLKALMERFPLELQVVWDDYTDVNYKTLLEKRFGSVDPIIPFILAQYHVNGITISPRIAIDAYGAFETCGPESLEFFADFAKAPNIIKDALTKYANTVLFRTAANEVEEVINSLTDYNNDTPEGKHFYKTTFKTLKNKIESLQKMNVDDSFAAQHAKIIGSSKKALNSFQTKYDEIAKEEKAAKVKKATSKLDADNHSIDDMDLSAFPVPDPFSVKPKVVKKRKSSYNFDK